MSYKNLFDLYSPILQQTVLSRLRAELNNAGLGEFYPEALSNIVGESGL